MRPEVWITGMGAVTAAGLGIEAIDRLLEREQGALTTPSGLGGHSGGVAPDPVCGPAGRRLDRSARLFLAACREAWSHAGLDRPAEDVRAGVIEGSSLGPMADLLADHAESLAEPRRRARPSRLTRFMAGAGGAVFAQEAGIGGPVFHLSAGSVSAACAIGEGFARIAAGTLDLAVVGGGEAPLHPEVVRTFAEAGVLAPADGEQACRPFDQRRCGTVLGEGGAAVVLESSAHARRRGAIPLARVVGYGFCTESHGLTAPDPSGRGVLRAATEALADDPTGPAWVKAHGTGTILNDRAELSALSVLLGPTLSTVPVVSLKSTLGHCLGASGAVEAVAVVLALRAGFAPATIGFGEPDPVLPACGVAPHRQPVRRGPVLLLSESFGGRCTALAIGPM